MKPSRTPLWGKLLAVVALKLALIFVVLHLSGTRLADARGGAAADPPLQHAGGDE